jgi:hypothetical protein
VDVSSDNVRSWVAVGSSGWTSTVHSIKDCGRESAVRFGMSVRIGRRARSVPLQGVSSVDASPPTPSLLKLRDGGVLCRHTPSPTLSLARNVRRRGFLCRRITTNPSLAQIARRRGYLSTHTLPNPLPRSKHETEGVPLSMHHHQPLPRSNCKTEGFSVDTPPSTHTLC